MNTIQIRIDNKTKKAAKRVLDELGLDMSAAIKLYFRQIGRTKGIPFALQTDNGLTVAQEERLIDESNRTLRDFRNGKAKGYASTQAMMRDLLA